MKACALLCLLGVAGVVASSLRHASDKYKGAYIGKLSTLQHDVTGYVYAINDTFIYIEHFSYDGEGPDAYFFAGNNSPTPTSRGFIIPNEKGSKEVLGPYRRKNIILRFPITKKGQRSLKDVKWVSVWCRKFAIDFGHVLITKALETPSPQKATGLYSAKPLVSAASVTILDTLTIVVEDFSFDGTVRDAIFVMGSGDASSSGSQVPNERGSTAPLGKYTSRTLTLRLPDPLDGHTPQYFGVWSPTKGMLASVTFDPDALVPPALSSLV